MIAIFFFWYLVVYGGLMWLLLQDPTTYTFANQHSSLFYALTMFAALVISVGPALVFVRTRPEPKEEAQEEAEPADWQKAGQIYQERTGKDPTTCQMFVDWQEVME
jgi:hypothetical protein